MKLIILLCIVFTSCQMEPVQYDFSPDVEKQNLGIDFASFDESWKYISSSVFQYSYETREEWQTPAETFYTMKGDCEDFALLLGYFVEAEGRDVKFVAVDYGYAQHAILKVDGNYLEPRSFGFFLDKKDLLIMYEMEYAEAYKLSFYR